MGRGARRCAEARVTKAGYIAAGELHDGPFCVLSIVDMQRDLQAPGRSQTTATLHHQRHDAG